MEESSYAREDDRNRQIGQLYFGDDEVVLHKQTAGRRDEKTLRDKEKYIGAMLRHSRQASMVRFDPKSKGKALEIIKPHLNKSFAPEIPIQVVDPPGPILALGETDAGRVVAENLEKLHRATGQLEELQGSQNILAQKFDEKAFRRIQE
ncbi:hypothetical protein OEA41_004177 [Lepraria neglecta]|uniref:Uncharacterized protein n=1 Tax=Lepraria neglecta TaxID=209136 RepID=A0AAE0DJ40_9LECA|nr:hypothetical protein OEA41_004177 [Lepraria neglecta]